MKFEELLTGSKFLIGMNHLPAVSEGMSKWMYCAEKNAYALTGAGIKAMILENDGDKDIVANRRLNTDPERLLLVRSYMTRAGQKLRKDYGSSISLGIQILWNDPYVVNIARETGADFIRSQLWWETRVGPPGLVLDPICGRAVPFGQKFPQDLAVLADIDSKGTLPLGDYSMECSIASLLASEHKPAALVVTGSATGTAPDMEGINGFCNIVRKYDTNMPVLLGSGYSRKNISLISDTPVRGAIVGTSIKGENGLVSRMATMALNLGTLEQAKPAYAGID